MFGNNKKAKELSVSAKEMLYEADSELKESSCQLNDNLQAYIALRSSVTSKTLKDFDDTYFNIKNIDFDDTNLNVGHGELENIDHMFQNTLENIQDVEVQEVKSGSVGASFKAAFYAIAAFVVVILVGIFASGSNIYLDKMPDAAQLNTLLSWFGNLIAPGRGDATKGALLLGGMVALIVFLVIFIKITFRARQNLKKAERSFEEANAAHEKKNSQTKKKLTLSEYALSLSTTLKTLQVYLNEFNAIMQRILHVEGDNYEEYARDSKKDIRTAVTINKRINSIIRTNVISKNGEITPETRQALEKCQECLDEHTKAGK